MIDVNLELNSKKAKNNESVIICQKILLVNDFRCARSPSSLSLSIFHIHIKTCLWCYVVRVCGMTSFHSICIRFFFLGPIALHYWPSSCLSLFVVSISHSALRFHVFFCLLIVHFDSECRSVNLYEFTCLCSTIVVLSL